MLVTTESGTEYAFNADLTSVMRVGDRAMRRDNQWVDLKLEPIIILGEPMVLWLEPLGDGDVTVRQTSPVVSIEEG